MKIAIGSDHAGFDYKKRLADFLSKAGHEVTDFGAYSTNSADYPDFAHPVASSVENGEADFGVLCCGSGQGVAITANKHQGVRAALVWDRDLAELSRQHNNANVICIPARFIAYELAEGCVIKFLETKFESGRHATRVGKISC